MLSHRQFEKLSILERLAFLNEPLKTYGICNFSVIPSFSAIRMAISSLSIAQGPASKKSYRYLYA
jgi:hypothetical protein